MELPAVMVPEPPTQQGIPRRKFDSNDIRLLSSSPFANLGNTLNFADWKVRDVVDFEISNGELPAWVCDC